MKNYDINKHLPLAYLSLAKEIKHDAFMGSRMSGFNFEEPFNLLKISFDNANKALFVFVHHDTQELSNFTSYKDFVEDVKMHFDQENFFEVTRFLFEKIKLENDYESGEAMFEKLGIYLRLINDMFEEKIGYRIE